jgi:hypothetical protein
LLDSTVQEKGVQIPRDGWVQEKGVQIPRDGWYGFSFELEEKNEATVN